MTIWPIVKTIYTTILYEIRWAYICITHTWHEARKRIVREEEFERVYRGITIKFGITRSTSHCFFVLPRDVLRSLRFDIRFYSYFTINLRIQTGLEPDRYEEKEDKCVWSIGRVYPQETCNALFPARFTFVAATSLFRMQRPRDKFIQIARRKGH